MNTLKYATHIASAREEGIALAARIMASLDGRVGVRINGELVQWNSLKRKSHLHVGDNSIPVVELASHLTQHEREELENLPTYDGNNEYAISLRCLILVRTAIRRFAGPDHGSDRFPPLTPVEIQEKELWECCCGACKSNDTDTDDL